MTTNDQPDNEYGRGFQHGHRAGYSSGRASRSAEIEQYRRRIHELDQENHMLRRIVGRSVEPWTEPEPEIRVDITNTHPADLADTIRREGVILHG